MFQFETAHSADQCLKLFSNSPMDSFRPTLPNLLFPSFTLRLGNTDVYLPSYNDVFYRSGFRVTVDPVNLRNEKIDLSKVPRYSKTVSEAKFNLNNWKCNILTKVSTSEHFVLLDAGEVDLILDRKNDQHILNSLKPNDELANIEISYAGDRLQVEQAKGILRTSISSKILDVYKARKKNLTTDYVDRLGEITGKLTRESRVFAVFGSGIKDSGLAPDKIKNNLLASVQYNATEKMSLAHSYTGFESSLLSALPLFYGLENIKIRNAVYTEILDLAQGKSVAEFNRAINTEKNPEEDSRLFDAVLLKAFRTAEKDQIGLVVILTDDKTETIFRDSLKFNTIMDVNVFGVNKHLMALEISDDPNSPYQVALTGLKKRTSGFNQDTKLVKSVLGLD